MIEHRYEENGDEYILRSWDEENSERVTRGLKAHRAVWLQEILEVARIGGYLYKIHTPPPDALLWFTTDDRGLLLSFGNDDPAMSIAYQLELELELKP